MSQNLNFMKLQRQSFGKKWTEADPDPLRVTELPAAEGCHIADIVESPLGAINRVEITKIINQLSKHSKIQRRCTCIQLRK